MAIRTASTTARSSSHSTQRAPQKSSSAQCSSSTQRASTPTQSKQTSSAPKRDTFTRSAQTAKLGTNSKSSQTRTSTAKTAGSNIAAKTKPESSACKTKRDSFGFSSEAVKKSARSAAAAKSATKGNSSNKGTKGSSKGKTKSAQSKVPEGLKAHLRHTNDPKQKAGMRKTAENYAAGKVADQISKKLKELGIDLSAMDVRGAYTAELTEAQQYTVVPDNDDRIGTTGYITQSDYERIINWMAHEAGDSGTDRFGVASAILNELDADGRSFGSLHKTFTAALDAALHENQKYVENGDRLGYEVSNDPDGILRAKCKDVLDYTLLGNRAFSQDVIYFFNGGQKDKSARSTSKFAAETTDM